MLLHRHIRAEHKCHDNERHGLLLRDICVGLWVQGSLPIVGSHCSACFVAYLDNDKDESIETVCHFLFFLRILLELSVATSNRSIIGDG